MITLTINGERREVDVPPDMALLWVLRDVLSLTGTKFGCRIAQCGAAVAGFYTNLTGGPPTTVSAVEVDRPLMPADPPERDRLHDRLERSSARLCSR